MAGHNLSRSCAPIETGSQILLSNNIALTIVDGAESELDALIAADLARLGLREERRDTTRVGGEDAVVVHYHGAASGRAGVTAYAAHGGRIYRLTFELRNPAACGDIDPATVYDLVHTSLQFDG